MLARRREASIPRKERWAVVIGCACGKNRRSAAPAGSSYTYEFTSPDGLITETYLTPLEAKRAVRRSGGGTIRRTTIKATA